MVLSEIAIEFPVNEIESFCKKWDIVEMSLFGSVLRGDFAPASDVDVLITFADGARLGLFVWYAYAADLRTSCGEKWTW